jgi:hypothetical protein
VYFSKFPLIKYQEIFVTDITRRTNFIEQNLSDPYVFLPYTVKDGEKPEDIALLYYGSVDYTWLVLLSNNINDPYSEWYITEDDFHRYLIDKYSTLSGKKDFEVIDWLKNETIKDNIVYYYLETDGTENLNDILDIDSNEINSLKGI